MSITQFLNGSYDPEMRRVIGVAYEMARAAFQLRDKVADEVIAKKIIEFAEAGETNPDPLCEQALNYFQRHM
jgi:hypothetical protein